MKAKEFLSRARRLDVKINAKLEQLEQLRSLASKVTASMGAEKVSNGTQTKDALELAVIKIIMAQQEINNEIDRLVDVKNEISHMLLRVDNDDYRLLLELRYLCFQGWGQIADKFHFSMSYTYQMHTQALDDFDGVLARDGRYANE